jgi:hypothetical protein
VVVRVAVGDSVDDGVVVGGTFVWVEVGVASGKSIKVGVLVGKLVCTADVLEQAVIKNVMKTKLSNRVQSIRWLSFIFIVFLPPPQPDIS